MGSFFILYGDAFRKRMDNKYFFVFKNSTPRVFIHKRCIIPIKIDFDAMFQQVIYISLTIDIRGENIDIGYYLKHKIDEFVNHCFCLREESGIYMKAFHLFIPIKRYRIAFDQINIVIDMPIVSFGFGYYIG